MGLYLHSFLRFRIHGPGQSGFYRSCVVGATLLMSMHYLGIQSKLVKQKLYTYESLQVVLGETVIKR